LAKEHRLTVVIVEHVFNIPLVLDIATVVWTLTDGKIQQETVAEAKADPSVQNTSALSALIREMASPAAVVTEESLPRGATLTRVFRPGVPREPLLTIKGLVAHRGHRLVVGNAQEPNRQGFDLTVHKGELVLLHAPNGWGKTSLMEVLSGILPCQEGSIHLDGANLEHKAAWERHADGLSVIPARDTGFCNLTISEFQRITRGVQPASDFSANCTTRGRLMSSLSGGERKRLALQTATRNSGKVRIWDEPFTSLDATAATSLCNNLFPDAVSASLVLIPSSHASPYF
jgi:ABC-type branched-subunit amino acid transport system ATPase component